MLRRCYVRADVIILIYEVPYIFWHYINVESLSSRITIKKVLQSAMELLQIATAQFITKCDGPLLQIATAFLLQSATRFITNYDRYYKVRWINYKLRQVLRSAMIITNCDSTDLPKAVKDISDTNRLSTKLTKDTSSKRSPRSSQQRNHWQAKRRYDGGRNHNNNMPRGHEHISFVFSSTFWYIFSQSFLRIRL